MKLPAARQPEPEPPSPADVARLLTAAWEEDPPLAVYLWLAVTSGARRGGLCAVRWHRLDLDAARTMKVARNYTVRRAEAGEGHEDAPGASDGTRRGYLPAARRAPGTLPCAARGGRCRAAADAFVFSHDPAGLRPWNPDSVTHRVGELAKNVGVVTTIKSLRHYNATSSSPPVSTCAPPPAALATAAAEQ